jgi:NAD(P)-dependent dehydrogenase (short-subunit alcohol dehydrogenase family)
MRLADKVAIITGAATGIGRTAAIMFAREGAKVICCDINDAEGRETVHMAGQTAGAGGAACYISCDVASAKDVQRTVQYAIEKHGRLDVVYNNAGTHGPFAACVETDEEDWDRVMQVNLKGCFLFSKYAIPELLKQESSSLIHTASVSAFGSSGLGVFPPVHAYAASVGGIVSFSYALAARYGPQGLRSNVICPGFIRTPMHVDAQESRDFGLEARILEGVPTQRLGEAEDVANVAVFLASDESSYITGAAIPVDGGISVTFAMAPRGTDGRSGRKGGGS